MSWLKISAWAFWCESAGLRPQLCPTPVDNVQINQTVKAFFARQSRWP